MLCWYSVGLTSCYFWMELIAIFAGANLGECKALWRLAQNFGERYGINLGRHDYQVLPMKGKLAMNSVGRYRC